MSKQILVALLIFPIVGLCQNPEAKRTNIWYFGNGAGLDFSSGSPVAITNGALHSYEGGGVMCDLEGNLLFYTDGDTVWNRLHQPMPNGTGLFGCGNYGSSAQNGLIIPKPGSETIFYIFTNDCSENFCEKGLRFSVVDISLNSGYGDVTEKNILLLEHSTEALAATKHANGVDYWIMGHEYNTNRFLCFLLDEDGVSNQPIISEIGLEIIHRINCIKFSFKSDKLAMAYDNIDGIDQLFDFNSNNGQLISVKYLSNLDKLPTGTGYFTAFSPDDSKLYFMTSGSYIYQYCLAGENTQEDISSTATLAAYNPENTSFGQLQLGLDNKIYISSLFNDSLSTMEFPNLYGTACGVQVRNLYLGGRQSLLGLPSFVSSYFYNDELKAEDCDTIQSAGTEISNDELLVFPNPSNGLIQIKLNKDCLGKISLYNSIGQEVFRADFQGKDFSLNISGIASGFYHIIVERTDNYSHEQNIILQKH